jgi:hypothetical protein
LIDSIHLLRFETLDTITGVNVHHWHHENRDDKAHGGKGDHDIEVGIDTVSEHQEWVIHDSVVTFWHLDSHLF